MITRSAFAHLTLFVIWLGLAFAPEEALSANGSNAFVFRSITVNGKPVSYVPGKEVNLGASPKNINFIFAPAPDQPHVPVRIRCKMDNVDRSWLIGMGEMNLVVRFLNDAGDRIAQKSFPAHGDSAGWNGTLDGSTLTHRRETLTVPPDASQLWVVTTSAGPPTTTGIYVVDNLSVSGDSANTGRPQLLLRSPFDQGADDAPENEEPYGWQRDGTHPSMAKIVEIGQDPKIRALAIIDDDRFGHAEWHNSNVIAPKVIPNEKLVVEWNEMFSIGEGGLNWAAYDTLEPGIYNLRVQELDVWGNPTGAETVLTVRVPKPMWKTPWFWTLAAACAVGGSVVGIRYVARRKLQQATLVLRQQRVLEQERLRIARDIHDDLGARATQISLMSGVAQNDATFSDKARAQFDRISTMSRDLVAALYETVWVVNPENDNLDAMVNYICEKINEFCHEQSQLRCRLHVPEIPKGVEISSRARHNMSMTVKEAMHNIIKHSAASLVTVRFSVTESWLCISIEDNGCGFKLDEASSGYGLVNMNRRMEEIGGRCQINSEPDKGTSISLCCPHKGTGGDSCPRPSPLMESNARE